MLKSAHFEAEWTTVARFLTISEQGDSGML
jgi:hypothetical protein